MQRLGLLGFFSLSLNQSDCLKKTNLFLKSNQGLYGARLSLSQTKMQINDDVWERLVLFTRVWKQSFDVLVLMDVDIVPLLWRS